MQQKDQTDSDFGSPFDVVNEVHKEIKDKKEPRSSLLNYSSVPKPNDPVKIPLTTEEKEAFDVLLGQLLDDRHVSQACQLAQQFGHYDQDLAVVVVRPGARSQWASAEMLTMGTMQINGTIQSKR